MQEKKLNPFDDLDTIELDLSGTSTNGFSATDISSIDLSGAAAQPVYTLDTMNYDTISYSGANISTISLPTTSGGGGSIGAGQYTYTTNVTSGSGGGGGGYTITTGTGGYVWNTTTTAADPSVNITQNGIDMPKDADIKIGDRSLKEFMTKMEERMAILVPDPKKLEKFEALKRAYENYKLMERLCQEDNAEKDQ